MKNTKHTKRTRQHIWSIRMSDCELKAAQKQLEKSGRTKRDFTLHALLSITILNDYAMNSILPELRRIGNNINQIAYSCNQGNQATYDEIVEIRKELRKVWQLLKAHVAALH